MRTLVNQVSLNPPSERSVSDIGAKNHVSIFSVPLDKPGQTARASRDGDQFNRPSLEPRPDNARLEERAPAQVKERTSAYLSMDHSSISAREDCSGGGISGRGRGKPSGGGESLRQRKERAALYPCNEPSISRTDKPRLENYLELKKRLLYSLGDFHASHKIHFFRKIQYKCNPMRDHGAYCTVGKHWKQTLHTNDIPKVQWLGST